VCRVFIFKDTGVQPHLSVASVRQKGGLPGTPPRNPPHIVLPESRALAARAQSQRTQGIHQSEVKVHILHTGCIADKGDVGGSCTFRTCKPRHRHCSHRRALVGARPYFFLFFLFAQYFLVINPSLREMRMPAREKNAGWDDQCQSQPVPGTGCRQKPRYRVFLCFM